MSLTDEEHQCTQWEGVSQTGDSAAPPTRTLQTETQTCCYTKSRVHSPYSCSFKTANYRDTQAKCCYWEPQLKMQLLSFEKLQTGIRLWLLLLIMNCLCYLSLCQKLVHTSSAQFYWIKIKKRTYFSCWSQDMIRFISSLMVFSMSSSMDWSRETASMSEFYIDRTVHTKQ